MSTAGWWVRRYGLLLWWLSLLSVMMVVAWRSAPMPSLSGAPGVRLDLGGLLREIALSLVELSVLLGVLRPWSYRRSWGRALTGLVLLVPWTIVFGLSAAHGGRIVGVHFLWLELTVVALLLLALGSVAAAFRERRQATV